MVVGARRSGNRRIKKKKKMLSRDIIVARIICFICGGVRAVQGTGYTWRDTAAITRANVYTIILIIIIIIIIEIAVYRPQLPTLVLTQTGVRTVSTKTVTLGIGSVPSRPIYIYLERENEKKGRGERDVIYFIKRSSRSRHVISSIHRIYIGL